MMKILILFLYLSSVLYLSAEIINIPADKPTIQVGIDTSTDADTILVHPGTYYENINFNGKNITVASLFFTTQDTSYISQTIIDGNQNGSVVIFENEEHLTTKLCGLTITNGNAYYGGGIKCRDYSSPSLKNLIISNNYSVYSGGGLYCKNNSSPELEDVIIMNNSTFWGGGIYCDNDSNLYIENVEIVNNSSNYGSGIYCGDSNPILKNLIITGNTGSRGGGIYFSHSIPSLENTIIANNTSNYGGGIYNYYSNISLVNLTITNNIAFTAGGGVRCSGDSHPHLVNCILWNNSPEEISFNETGEPSSTFIEYSDIEGGESGIVTNYNAIIHWLEGNIEDDPIFTITGNYPFSLQNFSPCVNSGTPDTTGLNLPEIDIIGNPRIYGGRIDMGAYENQTVVVGASSYLVPLTNFNLSNYPNPFNPTTTISFTVTQTSSFVNLTIYNIKGRKIKHLIKDQLSAGQHSVVWDGKDDYGKKVSSGVYLYKLTVNDKTKLVKKCILLK